MNTLAFSWCVSLIAGTIAAVIGFMLFRMEKPQDLQDYACFAVIIAIYFFVYYSTIFIVYY
jgi:hypothetical protein